MSSASLESVAVPATPRSFLKRLWAWTTDKLLSSVIMLVLGLGIGSWWNNASPHLSYTMSQPIRFSGEKENFDLFVVTFFSDGRKTAENVTCEVDLGDCVIEDIKGEPQFLKPDIVKSGGKASVTVSSMNPTESIELAIKASRPKDPSTRKVSLRGKDVVGSVKATEKSGFWEGFNYAASIVGLAATALVVALGISTTKTLLKVYKQANDAELKLQLSEMDKQTTEFRQSLKESKPAD